MENKNVNAIQELKSASGAEVYSMLSAAAWTVKKRAAGKGYFFAEFIRSADDAQTVAAEAYLTLAADAEKAAAQGEPLTVAAFRAAWKAAKRINAAEIRNAAESIEASADDDEQRPEIIPTAKDDPAADVAALDAITRAAADDTDKKIITMLAKGATRAEAAAALHVSRQAIEKRLQKIRARVDL